MAKWQAGMNGIGEAAEFWDRLADSDPLWAILSEPTRRDGKWDLPTFFETGRREVSTLMYQLEQLAPGPPQRRAALDFGCGVGRLTQALGEYYSEVVGVDVSEKMVSHARRLNRRAAVRFVHNPRSDLSALGSERFDLIYSNLVFQHIPPDASRLYIAECVRLLENGGVFVFQLPSHPRTASSPAVTPMPADAYRASIGFRGLPGRWPAGAVVRLQLRIRNDSPCAWDQARVGSIRLGNHWLSSSGSMLIQDDGRTSLPSRIAPGEQVDLALDVTIPPDGGQQVEVDLVHEGFSWFKDLGSSTARHLLHGQGEHGDTIRGESSPGGPDWDASLPVGSNGGATGDVELPMHGVPRPEVEEQLERLGTELILVEDDDRGGPEWVGYRYFARKPARGRPVPVRELA